MSPKLPFRQRPPSVTTMAPLRFAAASLSTNSDRLTTSSIVPRRRRGIACLSRMPTSPAKRRRAPSVSPIGPGAIALTRMPWGPHSTARVARQRIDGGLRRRDVQLAGGPAVVQGGADVEDLATVVAHPGVIGGAGDMPGPLGVDVQNRAEPVGREVGRGAEEVARGAVDQDVESAQVLQHAGDRRLHLRGLAHVGDQRQAAQTRCPGDRRRRQLQVLRLPAEQGSARPCAASASAIPRPMPVPPPVTRATRSRNKSSRKMLMRRPCVRVESGSAWSRPLAQGNATPFYAAGPSGASLAASTLASAMTVKSRCNSPEGSRNQSGLQRRWMRQPSDSRTRRRR